MPISNDVISIICEKPLIKNNVEIALYILSSTLFHSNNSMKPVFNKTLTASSLSILNASEYKKNFTPAEFYFQYKVDGLEYTLNSFPNCRINLKEDTTFLFNANGGFETIGISIVKPDRTPITTSSYKLDQNPWQNATYTNSTFVNDAYNTDSLHKGVLEIISFDQNRKVISGIFSFQAYNPVRKKTIHITDGKFRLRYVNK